MSKNINPQQIEDQTLSYLDAKYLRDRGRLPKGYPMPDPPEVDDEDRPAKPSKHTPLEEQSVPKIEAKGGIVADVSEEEYEDGWNNDQRRAELSKRGLSVEGKKDDLIGRLRRSDADELIDGDLSDIED
jgi:hypothetical protein